MSHGTQILANAAEGLDLERRLFEGDGTSVGLWTSRTQSLVCPRAYMSRAGFDPAVARSRRRSWPVHLRPTGGGAVPQGPGIDNLVLAFDAPPGAVIDDVYRLLTTVISRGLGCESGALEAGETPGSFCDGAWNLSHGGRKIVGTAQRWRPRQGKAARVLAHALILTGETFHDGAEAVARFNGDLGLGPVRPDAHTSLTAAFGIARLPSEALARAARQELAAFGAQGQDPAPPPR
ncbi:MAG: hypothetical protein AAGF78_08960 [Pseudomonadota bacterium]